MKSAIYARVSTSDQDCGMQLRELREYALRRGWDIAGEYVDTGWSGAKASRPQLDRLMQDASKRSFDAVLVYKLDRFGRSVRNCLDGIEALRAHGVRFLAISQNIDTDESNPTSRLMLHILAAVAEFERELIRERTLVGLRFAKANGKQVGRPKRVFRRDDVVQLREEGHSWRSIASKLGIPVMTAVDAYRSYCTETVAANGEDQCGKTRANRQPSEVYEALRLPYTLECPVFGTQIICR